MTPEEMRVVVRGAMQADGECVHCAARVIESIATILSPLPWQEVWIEIVNNEFGYSTRGFAASADILTGERARDPDEQHEPYQRPGERYGPPTPPPPGKVTKL